MGWPGEGFQTGTCPTPRPQSRILQCAVAGFVGVVGGSEGRQALKQCLWAYLSSASQHSWLECPDPAGWCCAGQRPRLGTPRATSLPAFSGLENAPVTVSPAFRRGPGTCSTGGLKPGRPLVGPGR